MAAIIAGVVVCASVYKRKQAARMAADRIAQQNHVRMDYLDRSMQQQPLLNMPDAVPMPPQRCTSSDVHNQ